MNIKEELYKKCFTFIENRLETINITISEIQKALESETKSSAGDKHETGRAMLQIEREKAGNQLVEVLKIKEVFSKIDIYGTSKIAKLGSIVFTTQNNYFISISAGEIKIDQGSFYAISPNTPIGQLLISKKLGDEISFKNQKFQITEVI